MKKAIILFLCAALLGLCGCDKGQHLFLAIKTYQPAKVGLVQASEGSFYVFVGPKGDIYTVVIGGNYFYSNPVVFVNIDSLTLEENK